LTQGGINKQNSNRNDGNEEQQEKEEFTTLNKFENQLLSIIDERQKMIYPNCHPIYNERHQKIIELIDWTLEKYRGRIKETHKEQVIIDDIIEELDKKRDRAIHKKKRAMLKDEVAIYRLEEDTIDYVLFRLRELTGKLI
jgi:hypothetical protein